MLNKRRKVYDKEKSFISLLLAFCLIVPAMIMLPACGSDIPNKLSNDSGFVVEGGDFAEGSVLEANAIDSTSDEYEEALTIIASESYDNTKPVYVFEISVKKDNVKVQPNGKVKVSVPVSADLTGYAVLHIKSDGKIERLTVTYKNGIASFETDSFSTFVFVATGTINPIQTAGSEAEWNNAINYWKAQNNIKVVEIFSSEGNGDPASPSRPNQTMIYQLDGTKYSEDGYFDDEAESSKSKAKYIVKEGETYYRVEWAYGESEDDGFWRKIDYMADIMYDEYLNRNIYNCIDFYSETIDFTYTNFSYDATNNVYKNGNETVVVGLTFGNGNLIKMVVTVRFDDSGIIRTSTRTITFGNAEVTVPQVSE